MFSSLKDNLYNHMRDNAALYLIALFSLLVGLTAGSFSALRLSDVQSEGMKDFIAAFLDSTKDQSFNVWRVLLQSFINNMQILVLIGGLGLFMIGFPFIIVLIAGKGLLLGFTMGILCDVLGFKGLLIFTLCIIPANLVLIPAFLRGSVLSLSNSIYRFKTRRAKVSPGNPLPMYYKQFITIILVSLIGVLLEGLLQPVLINIFA